MINELGKSLILIGFIILIFGVILLLSENPKISLFKKLGSLPGDIKIKGKNFVFYFPITTSILISLVLTLLFFFIKIIFK